MKYCSDRTDYDGLQTLYDVVVNKEPFDSDVHDVESACEVAYHALHTLYEVEFEDGMIYGRSKVSLAGLMGDLVLLLERMANFREGQTDQWPNG
jgi:hypothetical protein